MESLPLQYTFLVLGAAQGVFLSLLLLSKRTDSAANKVMAVAMFSFSVFIFADVFYAQAYYLEYPRFIGFSQSIIFLFGPILYLYVRIVSAGERRFSRGYWAHFLPFLIYTVYLIPIFLQDGPTKIQLVESIMRGEGPFDLWLFGQLKLVHGLTYVVLAFRQIKRHEIRIKDHFSDIEKINLLWLRNLMIGIAVVWTIATLDVMLEWLGESIPLLGHIVPLATTVFVYTIGYLGLRQPEVFGGLGLGTSELVSNATALGSRSPTDATSDGVRQVHADKGSTRYERSGLSEENADAYLTALIEVMEGERLFVNSDLTLQDLSDRLDISAHNLSEVINTRLGKNFYDFVNGYRIEDVKERLTDPKYDYLTILALAQDAGFNSKSAFNTIFKKITQMTPSEYRSRERSEL